MSTDIEAREKHAAQGGAAFPHTGDHQFYPEIGMTLRDYFAAKALPIAFQQCAGPDALQSGWGTVTQIAYVIADHMLLSRSA